MRKSKQIEYYYVIIDTKGEVYIRKFLSKVENLTGIAQNTVSKHFSINKTPYKNDNWTIFKTSNVDLKSFNKGNKYNFITQLSEMMTKSPQKKLIKRKDYEKTVRNNNKRP